MRGVMPVALVASFAAGVLIDGWFRTYGPPRPASLETEVRLKPDTTAAATTGTATAIAAAPSPKTPVAERNPAPPAPVATSGDIPSGKLRVPLDGSNIETFKGGFTERRGGDRPHEAVDMLAPRNTPVHAVENGTIAKLFTSKAGGLTIYQFDPTGHLAYYYAHLERYAEGLKAGDRVERGQVIGYVGTTGNAPPNTPHLHFAIIKLTDAKRWWDGVAIDPYPVLK